MQYGSRHLGIAAALALSACADRSAGDESAGQMPPSDARAAAKPAAETAPAAVVPGPDLDAVLALTPDCRFGEPLASIFRQMTIIDQETFESRQGRAIRIPGLAEPLAPTFRRTVTGTDHGEEREVVAELPLTGRWRGLRVVGLRLSYFEESDVSGREIRFREPAERVRQALNRSGFSLPAIGEVRPVDPGEGIETLIGVDRTPFGSTLQCATG